MAVTPGVVRTPPVGHKERPGNTVGTRVAHLMSTSKAAAAATAGDRAATVRNRPPLSPPHPSRRACG